MVLKMFSDFALPETQERKLTVTEPGSQNSVTE